MFLCHINPHFLIQLAFNASPYSCSDNSDYSFSDSIIGAEGALQKDFLVLQGEPGGFGILVLSAGVEGSCLIVLFDAFFYALAVVCQSVRDILSILDGAWRVASAGLRTSCVAALGAHHRHCVWHVVLFASSAAALPAVQALSLLAVTSPEGRFGVRLVLSALFGA